MTWEEMLKAKEEDIYWVSTGYDVSQVRLIYHLTTENGYYGWHVVTVPEPQYYDLYYDVRLLYKTKEEALKRLQSELVQKYISTKDEIKRYKKALNNCEKELKKIEEELKKSEEKLKTK